MADFLPKQSENSLSKSPPSVSSKTEEIGAFLEAKSVPSPEPVQLLTKASEVSSDLTSF